jgi:hypothetical protein
MGKGETIWAVPVVEAQQATATVFEKRFSYYGINFPPICCVCGEAPATIAREVTAQPGLESTYVFRVPWCLECEREYEALQRSWVEQKTKLRPVPARALGVAFVFGIVWWLAFGFIQPGTLPAVGAAIWVVSILVFIAEGLRGFFPHSRALKRYEDAVKFKGVMRKGIIHREPRVLVAIKNEKFSEAFGKANPSAEIHGQKER